MSHDVAVESPTSVVEWGGDEPRRGFFSRLYAGRRFAMPTVNRQVVPVVAGLSGLALFASLVGEWQVTNMQDSGETRVVTASVAGIPGWGVSYVLGMFALVSCVALAMFGAARSRRNVRVVGLALTAALAIMLVAATKALTENSAVFSFFAVFGEGNAPKVSIGRGLHMAYVATLGFGLALHLAARFWPAPAAEAETATERADEGTRAGEPRRAAMWRRPAAAPDVDPGPADLTVSEAAPFAHLPEAKEGR